jgi:hypothetical protein
MKKEMIQPALQGLLDNIWATYNVEPKLGRRDGEATATTLTYCHAAFCASFRLFPAIAVKCHAIVCALRVA